MLTNPLTLTGEEAELSRSLNKVLDQHETSVEYGQKSTHQSYYEEEGYRSAIRKYLLGIIHSKLFNIGVILFAILDAVLLVCILLLEIEALRTSPGTLRDRLDTARFSLECSSLAIIILFAVEHLIKLSILGVCQFFQDYAEVLDLGVILISLAFDSYVIAAHCAVGHGDESIRSSSTTKTSLHEKGNVDVVISAAGLVILFRLWRIVRIVNATVVSLSKAMHSKIANLLHERLMLQRQVEELKRKLEDSNNL